MTRTNPDVIVIGAGVSGLSTALTLLGDGLDVTVQTAQLPQQTTSAVAGALWGAHLVGTDGAVRDWAAITLDRLRQLAHDPATGVKETRGLVAVRHEDEDPPPFTRGAGPLTPCDPADLPGGYAAGWRYIVPVVTMPTYLDHLTHELIRQGGRLHLVRPFASLAEAAERSAAPVIVNCSGMGALDLVPDFALAPVRGQVVTVANPGLTDFFVAEHNEPDRLTCIFPHGATALLGGTQQHDNASTAPDPATTEQIIRDCVAVEPKLAGAPVLGHRVGLRPFRPQIRLEVQPVNSDRYVVHNYGHGGAGVTLSWGCARAAADEVLRLIS